MSKLAKALTAAAGNAGGTLGYVEDVFSTYLYEGNNSTQAINNGLDLDGEGGLVWIKERAGTGNEGHRLLDTERGPTKVLMSNNTGANYTIDGGFDSFTSAGFTLKADNGWSINSASPATYASWTFRKAEKFFDVVTYTGTAATQNIAHNLGSVPGMIIVKSTTAAGGWAVWHNSLSSSTDHWLRLDWTNAEINQANFWPSAPTDSHFTVGGYAANNAENQTLVAYLFASDAGGFGDDGSENIIKCGVLTSTSSGFVDADCGFEPQWLLIKGTMTNNWQLFDNMRGVTTGNGHERLFANTSGAESSSTSDAINFTATGFKANTFTGGFNGAGNYIYIAIRRPMKTPESGTEVFKTIEQNWSTGILDAGFPVDLAIFQTTDAGNNGRAVDRLRGKTQLLYPNGPSAESGESYYALDNNEGFELVSSPVSNNWVWWLFKRATGFFDVVAYTGNGTAGRTVVHNLGVVPELMIVKQRPYTSSWTVYNKDIGAANKLVLDSTAALASATSAWNSTAPTATVFTLGSLNDTNENPLAFIAYLFATLAGVSKVGSYTGTAADLNVDCGFSAGARFILIKRTDDTGDWYVWDSVRGIVAGNDPYLLLNSDVAEVTSTDYIDPLSSGFTVTSSAPAALNASGGTYIFLAIA